MLTDQAETGAVTLALPQDVQAEAYDYPDELFERRVWRIAPAGARPGRGAGARRRARAGRAAAADRGRRRRHLLRGDRRAARVRRRDRHPRRRDAGRQGVAALRPSRCARRGRRDRHPGGQPGRPRRRPGDRDRHAPGRLHDRVAHRLPAPRRALRGAQRRRLRRRTSSARCRSSATPARASRRSPRALAGHRVDPEHAERAAAARRGSGTPRWSGSTLGEAGARHPGPGDRRGERARRSRRTSSSAPPAACRATCTSCGARAIPKGYHVEYGYSCMGYEVAGGLGVKLADPDREVIVMVGDGSWLMMSSEIATSIQEGVRLTVVLIDNHGFGSIGGLSRSLGSEGFGTAYRRRGPTAALGAPLELDLAANARSLGAHGVRVVLGRTSSRMHSRDARAARPHHRDRDRVRPEPRRRRPTSRGGTCPWPRSRRCRPSPRHARTTSASGPASAPFPGGGHG